MHKRTYWIDRIEAAWRRRPVVWLAGVRRAGKTILARTLPNVEYFDCELPRVRRALEDPEEFLGGLSGRRIVLDEVHRLGNPSEILKVAADHFPGVRVLATGSSTLGASAKFRDALTGRKEEVWLTPMTKQDLEDFGMPGLARRFLHGGLPPFFLADGPPEGEFQEWMDAYWAKDIQELFRLERRHAFQKFAELLMAQSGGIFEATRFAGPCEISRTTVSNYLAVLEATYLVHIVRPHHGRRGDEIIGAPKVYAFDTGFVCLHRGWQELRPDDLGPLWEHLVLNEFHAHFGRRPVQYWRDKRGHEVDFVLPSRRAEPVAVECKWKASGFDPAGLASFRRRHPTGANFLVASDVDRPYRIGGKGLSVLCVGLPHLVAALRRVGLR